MTTNRRVNRPVYRVPGYEQDVQVHVAVFAPKCSLNREAVSCVYSASQPDVPTPSRDDRAMVISKSYKLASDVPLYYMTNSVTLG